MAGTKTEEILASALKKIKPSDRKIFTEIDSFLKDINSEIKKNKVNAEAVIGGSTAKDTYLKGNHDCDVFLRFDYSYKDQDSLKKYAADNRLSIEVLP